MHGVYVVMHGVHVIMHGVHVVMHGVHVVTCYCRPRVFMVAIIRVFIFRVLRLNLKPQTPNLPCGHMLLQVNSTDMASATANIIDLGTVAPLQHPFALTDDQDAMFRDF